MSDALGKRERLQNDLPAGFDSLVGCQFKEEKTMNLGEMFVCKKCTTVGFELQNVDEDPIKGFCPVCGDSEFTKTVKLGYKRYLKHGTPSDASYDIPLPTTTC